MREKYFLSGYLFSKKKLILRFFKNRFSSRMSHLSIFPAMGHSSLSAKFLQVSFSMTCVSGKSVKVAELELELEDLQLDIGEHLRAADDHKTRPSSDDISVD